MNTTWQSILEFDARLSERLRLTAKHPVWKMAAILAHSGDSWLWAIGVGLVWLFNMGGLSWHRSSAILEISIVIQALFVFGLKALIRRQRPSGSWGVIYRQYDPHSFPSGHATRAILLSVMAAQLGPAWFAWLLAIWAPLVCLSRVFTGVHYVSDILGGMLLGLLMGLLLMAISPIWVQIFPFLY